MAEAAELDEINDLILDRYALPRPTTLPGPAEGEHLELQRWRWAQVLAGSRRVPPGEPDLAYQGYEPRDEAAATAVLDDLLAGLDRTDPRLWAPDAAVLGAFLAARTGRAETARSHLRSWVEVARADGREWRPRRVLVLSPLRALVLEGALMDAIGIDDRQAARSLTM